MVNAIRLDLQYLCSEGVESEGSNMGHTRKGGAWSQQRQFEHKDQDGMNLRSQ